MRRVALVTAVVVALLAGGAAVAWGLWSGPVTAGPPNVVVVVACTLRRDQLTPYGGVPQTSPFLQQVADRGVRFADAIDAAPWTRAASTALMTGYHPVQVGMVEPEPHPSRRALPDEVTTLAEYMQGAGYETVGITANPNTNRLFGFDQGFDAYAVVTRGWESMARKPSTQDLADRALELLDARSRPDAPLYLRLMVIDAHEPIRVPARVSREFRPDQVPRRVGAYRSMVRQLDDGIRHLWHELGTRGFTAENTVLVVVNDHGEGLRWPVEHGKGHGNHLHLSAVGMPWLMQGPGVASGHVIDGMASQVDLLPTLLGVAGVSSDYAGPGRDWSALVGGRGNRTDRREAFTDTWFQRSSRAAIYTEDRACLHDFEEMAEERGFQRKVPRTACYDLASDPRQREPQPADPELFGQLETWREARRAEYDAWPHHDDIRIPDDVAAQLEALGYAQ